MGRVAPALHLAPALLLALAWLAAPPASAQSPGPPGNQGLVVRDGTLGSAPAGVVAPGPDDLGTADYLIRADLGEQRDRNLFHSFKLFSIGRGERATFTDEGAPNPAAIENVISRVTGDARSDINGVLHSTIPGADVWLLNPNGVMFGAGAELDVQGSFHASTADALDFDAEGLERFYSDPLRPSVLSTATPLAFGFLSEKGAALLAVDRSALEVADGETLELVGGDVSLTLAAVAAPGGDVRLAAQDKVGVSQSLVDVNRTGETPGTISIRGGKIVVEKSSLVRAENESGVPPTAGDAKKPGPGSIAIDASESVLVEASLLSVSTHGAGNAGTIDVASPEITLNQGLGFEPLAPSQESRAGLRAETTSSGRGGEIRLRADDLVSLANGIGVSTSAVGDAVSGNAGSVDIAARKVELKRGSHASAETAGAGAGGTIAIEAGESLLVDDSLLSVNTWSTGDAGTIRVAGPGEGLPSPDVTIQNGPGLPDTFTPRVTERGVRAYTTDMGAGGEISIDAGALVVSHGVGVDATAIGVASPAAPVARGDAGKVTIRADSVEVSDRSYIGAAGWGSTGKGGTIHIDLGDDGSLLVDGETDETQAPRYGARYAWIISSSGGIPGRIEIRADSVTVSSNGGGIHSNCNGGCIANPSGQTGAIEIEANSILLEEGGSIAANTGGAGNGGAIEIDARSLELYSGGQILARGAAGNGGSVVIEADTVQIGPGRETGKEGPGIFVTSIGTGNAGSVEITARDWIHVDDANAPRFDLSPILRGEAGLLTGIISGTQLGAGGPITLDAPEITVSNGAIVASSSVRGLGGGEITLTGKNIRVERGGFISGASFFTPSKAGDVNLVATESIEVSGQNNYGDPNVYGDPSQVSSSTLGQGPAGAVNLTAPRILIDGGAVSTVAVPLEDFPGGGAAGEITLDGGQVIVRRGGRVTATTMGPGDGGSIDILADESIRVEGMDSSIASRTGADGTGGNVVLIAPRIEVASDGKVSAESTHGLGELGAIVDFFRGFIKDPPNVATGDAGNVTIGTETARVKTLRVVGGAIATSAEAAAEDADAGKIAIHADRIVHLDAGEITASVNGGAGGNITIDPEVVILENDSSIVATARGGSGGNIQITADNYFAFPRSEVSAEADRQDLSGTVELHAPDVDLVGNLTVLPANFLDASSLMRERCAARRNGEASGSFAVRGNSGIPPEPDGWLRAPVVPDAAPTAADTMTDQQALVASLPGPLLAQATCE